MNYHSILNCDIANGEGNRITLFVSGCTLACPGCFNSDLWPFDSGKSFTKETEDKIIKLMEPEYIQGLSLLGGNPTEPSNEAVLIPFVKRVKSIYGNTKDIWMYSGHTWEYLRFMKDKLIEECDVIIEGPFKKELKDLTLRFRGSSNQRIIDIKKSLASNSIVNYYADDR